MSNKIIINKNECYNAFKIVVYLLGLIKIGGKCNH